MPSYEIYRNETLVQADSFQRNFVIARNPLGEIFWAVDYEDSQGGTIEIWVQTVSVDPKILYVPAHWRLTVDGNRWENKFHWHVRNLLGKTVELDFEDYHFVFRF
jgi:hypothetical protein